MTAISWPDVFARLLDGHHLNQDHARAVMGNIMAGEATEAQIAAFLTVLRSKGETADEMTGFVAAMRAAARSIEIDEPIVDLVGTGGDTTLLPLDT